MKKRNLKEEAAAACKFRGHKIEFNGGAWEAWAKKGYIFPDGIHCKVIGASPHAGKAWKKEALKQLINEINEIGPPVPCTDKQCDICND